MKIQWAGSNKRHGITKHLRLGLGILLLGAMTGCVGVDGGYYGETTVVDTGPDVGFWGGGFWGGGYHHGHDDYRFSNRGAASRAVAHGGGGGGHGGGGHR